MAGHGIAYPNLAKPVKIGAIEAKNSTFMSSLTRNRSLDDTVPNDVNLEYYVQRANAGIIFTEGTLVVRQGSEWPHAPGIWNDKQVEAWKKITDAVHAAGSKIVMQLWHLGRVNHPDMEEQKKAGEPVWAPSAVSARGGKFRLLDGAPGYVTPTAIPDPTIILDQFEHAATLAKKAGFDGVELHSANGYLIDQFLSDVSNTRTDAWGGSAENRTRFGVEVIKRLIKVWGADRVGAKLSPCGGYNDMSYTSPESNLETFHSYIKQLDALKVAWLQITQYNAYGDPKHGGVPQGRAYDVVKEYAGDIKHTAFIANCGYDPESAEKELEGGHVKAVVFGRGYLANPDFYRRAQEKLPLNQGDFMTFYNFEGRDIAKGYTDYPFA